MAIYPYKCDKCGKEQEVVQSIASYSKQPLVPRCCSEAMRRVMTSPLVTFDTAPWGAYVSPIDGSVIDSRSKRDEHMARHGVVPFDEIAPDVERNRKRLEKEAFADMKKEVVEATARVESGYKPEVASIDQIVPE